MGPLAVFGVHCPSASLLRYFLCSQYVHGGLLAHNFSLQLSHWLEANFMVRIGPQVMFAGLIGP